jgi:hypothetical protein
MKPQLKYYKSLVTLVSAYSFVTFCNHEMTALRHTRVCRTANKLGHAWCFITLERLSLPLCPWMGVRTFLIPLANYDARVNASGRKEGRHEDVSLQNGWQNVPFISPWKMNMNLNYISRLISSYRAGNTFLLNYKSQQWMIYRCTTAVCSEIHTKRRNALCGQNVE